MTRLLVFVPIVLAAFLGARPDEAMADERVPHFRLLWDDRLDGALDVEHKACEVELEIGEHELSGRFAAPVLDRERLATFSGEVFTTTDGGLITMKQVEEDYVCAYQLQPREGGGYGGAWHDERGRSGDVRLEPLSE